MRGRDFSKVKWTYKKLDDLKKSSLDTLSYLYMLKFLMLTFPEDSFVKETVSFAKEKNTLTDKQKETIKKRYIEHQESRTFFNILEGDEKHVNFSEFL